MKYSKFKRLMEDKGFSIDQYDYMVMVCDEEGRYLARVGDEIVGEIDSNYSAFADLSIDDREFILRNCVELSLTPLEEREEEEKFYYRLKGFVREEYEYLNYELDSENFFTCDKREAKGVKTQFTDSEFVSFPIDVKSHNWEKIKVESEE